MRYLAGTDPLQVRNRVAFIEKTPRIRVGPYTSESEDSKNWFPGYKGDNGWDAVSQGWCDQHLLTLGYLLENARPFDRSML